MKTYLTPSIDCKSCFSRPVFMLFGTASRMMPIESFIMVHVVIITIIENIKVHSGSAIFALGYKQARNDTTLNSIACLCGTKI